MEYAMRPTLARLHVRAAHQVCPLGVCSSQNTVLFWAIQCTARALMWEVVTLTIQWLVGIRPSSAMLMLVARAGSGLSSCSMR